MVTARTSRSAFCLGNHHCENGLPYRSNHSAGTGFLSQSGTTTARLFSTWRIVSPTSSSRFKSRMAASTCVESSLGRIHPAQAGIVRQRKRASRRSAGPFHVVDENHMHSSSRVRGHSCSPLMLCSILPSSTNDCGSALPFYHILATRPDSPVGSTRGLGMAILSINSPAGKAV